MPPHADVKHVVVLNPVAHVGGAEQSLTELIHALGGDPRVTLVVPEDGPLTEAAARVGAAICVLQWPVSLVAFGERSGVDPGGAARAALAVPRFVWRLGRLLRRLQPDVLVTNGIKAHILGVIGARATHTPVVWYLRESLEDRGFSRRVLAMASRSCRGAVAISRYVEEQWRPLMPPGARVEMLYNIVDRERFRPDGLTPPDLSKREGEIWFGMIGPVTPIKGHDLFVDACARVAPALPNARFLVVGDNLYRTEGSLRFKDELVQRARRHGLGDRILFLGHRNDVPAVLRTLDVLVQPNRGPEGLGRAILEAMATGVPVIAVDRWGPAELIADGETGLLTPWMDVDALSRHMIRLARDGALRRRLAVSAASALTARVDARRIADAFRAFLDEVT